VDDLPSASRSLFNVREMWIPDALRWLTVGNGQRAYCIEGGQLCLIGSDELLTPDGTAATVYAAFDARYRSIMGYRSG